MSPQDEQTLQILLQGQSRSAIVALAQSLYEKAKADLAQGQGVTQHQVAILNNARRVLQREQSQLPQE